MTQPPFAASGHDQPRFGSVTCRSPLGTHRMAYAEWGAPDNDQVLVCVHGVSRQGRDFDVLARAMCDEYRVICPDMVGRGRSDWLADVPGAHAYYDVSPYAGDCAALLTHVRARTVDWVGTSMGGLIAMELAASRGNPIRRLVLNDIGPVVLGSALDRIGTYLGKLPRWATVEEGIAYLAEVNASFGPHTDEEWRALSLPMIVNRQDAEGSYFTLHYDPRIGDAFRDQARVLAGADMDLWPFYDALTCETLALRGARSDLLSAAVHAEMGRRGPKAKLVEIAGVGHAPTLVARDQIELVRGFLLGRSAS